MKKLFTLILAIFANLGMSFAEYIEGVQIGDLYYNLIGDQAEVTYHSKVINGYGEIYYNTDWNITDANIPFSFLYNEQIYPVTKIGSDAFHSCANLTSVYISSHITNIESDAFAYCPSLASIIVDYENAHYDSRNNCNAVIETATNTLVSGCKNTICPNSITQIGNKAFKGCSGLVSIDIPYGVKSIGMDAFSDCANLSSVVIPNTVTRIREGAFELCRNLVSVTLSDSLEIIEDYAFQGCYSLQSIIIPNSVTKVNEGAFVQCRNLKSLTIGEGMTFLGDHVFYKCNNLTSVTCLAVVPPTMDTQVFMSVDCSQIPLHVPAGSVDTYKAADQWKEFNPILPIEEGIEQISQESRSNSQKLIKDGKIFILRGDKVYTVTGQTL